MFDKQTLVIAQAKEMAIEDGKSWNFLLQNERDVFQEKAEAYLTGLFHPEYVAEQAEKAEKAALERAEALAEVEVEEPCPNCGGKGFTEEQGGLLQIECEVCKSVEPEETEKLKPLKPGEIPANKFWCEKCLKLHMRKKNNGQPNAHLKYEVEG